MRIRPILLLSSASLAIPSGAAACDLEGPGGRYSAFAHMAAAMDQTSSSPEVLSPPSAKSSYNDDSRSPAADTTPTDYNTPSTSAPATDAEPSGKAVTR